MFVEAERLRRVMPGMPVLVDVNALFESVKYDLFASGWLYRSVFDRGPRASRAVPAAPCFCGSVAGRPTNRTFEVSYPESGALSAHIR